jgi:AAA+ ATPase superfamily predicted ATPase
MNPFSYGKIFRKQQFYDREEPFSTILSTVSGGNNVVLYAPRRYGKSSLVMKVMQELERKGIPCVYMDLMRACSVDDFIRLYARNIYQRQSSLFEKGLQQVMEWVKRLRPQVTLDDQGKPELVLDFSPNQLTTEMISNVFDLPERLSAKQGRMVVILDEFQEIEVFSDHFPLERIFRSCMQQHRHVTYLFLGSKTHLLQQMFSKRSRPFYQSAKTLSLGKPPFGESVVFVQKRFSDGGITLSKTSAERIVQEAANIPYYIQFLASELFQQMVDSSKQALSEEDVRFACRNITSLKSDLYEEHFGRLSVNQRKLIHALAAEGTLRFSDAYRQRYHLPVSSSINSAVKQLLEQGHIEKQEQGYEVADPFFKLWLLQLQEPTQLA